MLLIVTVISVCLYWLWTRRHFYRLSVQMPSIWALPIIASFFKLKNIHNIIDGLGLLWDHHKGSTYFSWLFTTCGICTKDPEVVTQILHGEAFREKTPMLYDPLRNVLKGGMLTLEGKEALHMRKTLSPAFRSKALSNLIPIMNEKSIEYLQMLEELCQRGGAHNIKNSLRIFTMNVSRMTIMGYTDPMTVQELDDLMDSLTFCVERASERGMLNLVNFGFLCELDYRIKSKSKVFYTWINKFIEFHCKRLGEDKHKRGGDEEYESCTFIEQGVLSFKAGRLTYEQLFGELTNILSASTETTSVTVYNSLIMLAMHPEVQERLFQEVLACFPSKNVDVKPEHFEQLTYMEMVIDETLRVFPSAPLIAREVTRDTQLKVNGRTYQVPRGIQVALDIFHMHRDPKLWGDDALKYNPDNFMPENVAKRKTNSFLPFSKGSRMCLGWRYAYFSMKITLTHIVRNYRIRTDFKYEDLTVGWYVFLSLNEDPLLYFEKR